MLPALDQSNCFEAICLEAAFNEHVANSVLLKAQENDSGNRSISPDAVVPWMGRMRRWVRRWTKS